MDVKEAFNYVSQAKLVQRIANLGIDNNLIGWTEFFLTDKLVKLAIDRFTNPKQKVEPEIPQRLPVCSNSILDLY